MDIGNVLIVLNHGGKIFCSTCAKSCLIFTRLSILYLYGNKLYKCVCVFIDVHTCVNDVSESSLFFVNIYKKTYYTHSC